MVVKVVKTMKTDLGVLNVDMHCNCPVQFS